MRRSNRQVTFALAFLLASLLASFPLSPLADAATRRQRAEKAYENAQRLRAALNSRPENSQPKSEYEKVIHAFKLVPFYDPACGKAPAALFAVAELTGEMGRRFSQDEYHRGAIQAYQHLSEQYPGAALSREALFRIAEVYRSDLGDTEKARQAYQDFIDKFPRSARATDAREQIKLIDRQAAEQAEAAAEKATRPERRSPAGLAEVTALRRWVGPSYTRIVINVEGEVKFESNRVPNPDRIVLDLLNSRLSPALVGKTFPVENGFLRQVRVGQFHPTVTRVVLDVEKIEDYSVFTLPNPFRLVIDINGPPVEVAEKTSQNVKETPAVASAATETAEGSKPAVAAPSGAKPVTHENKENIAQVGPATPTEEPTAGSRAKESEPPTQEAAALTTRSLPPATTTRKVESTGTTPRGTAAPIKAPSPTAAGSRTLTRALGLKIARIVIDPGHGGHDTGTIGPTGLKEKDVVLDVALRLKKLVEEKAGAEVIMTRSGDTFIPLEERTAIANQKGADLFISIHANASRDKRARGIETYFLNFTSSPEALEVAARENATTQESVHELQDLIKKIVLTEKIEESHDFAMQVQREVYAHLRKTTGAGKDRGVKKAPFVVLIGANMPSILAEISFLTNPQDERLMKKSDHRQRIADALYRGVNRYVHRLGGVRVAQGVGNSAENSVLPHSPPAGAPNF
ncbi:MAG: N-acetylmuramoyl-L-alanine amidase [Acidobacteriia bacterium]|nr:N-acetylmuramoyl-L-alanine amidase [Terriglobia bacterium]